jgi:hypothetical protein
MNRPAEFFLRHTIVMLFTKILCATDFSPGAEQALRTATQLSIQTGADLVVMPRS